jgi:hypothetical protein
MTTYPNILEVDYVHCCPHYSMLIAARLICRICTAKCIMIDRPTLPSLFRDHQSCPGRCGMFISWLASDGHVDRVAIHEWVGAHFPERSLIGHALKLA